MTLIFQHTLCSYNATATIVHHLRVLRCSLSSTAATRQLQQLQDDATRGDDDNHRKLLVTRAMDIFHAVPSYQRDYTLYNRTLELLAQHASSDGSALQNMARMYDEIVEERVEHISDKLLITCSKQTLAVYFDDTIRVLCFINTARTKLTLMHVYSRAQYFNLCRVENIFESIPRCMRTVPCHAAMIKAYLDATQIQDALQFLDGIRADNDTSSSFMVCLTMVMKWYMAHSRASDAIHLCDAMDRAHNDVSKVLYLKACVFDNCFEKGRALIDGCADENNIYVLNTMIDFYGHFGRVSDAVHVFRTIPSERRDAVSIGSMMRCLQLNRYWQYAMQTYECDQGTKNDVLTDLYLNACIHLNEDCDSFDESLAFEKGQQVIASHGQTLYECDRQLMRTVIRFYGHFKRVTHAYAVYEALCRIQKVDIFIVTAIMRCCMENDASEQAMHVYETVAADCPHIQHNHVSRALYLKASLRSGQCVTANLNAIDS